MSKSDPRPYDFILAPNAPAFTLTARFNGLTVLSIEGGTAKRNGVALAVGNVLATGDVILTGTPSATVTLACQRTGEEFSGAYADLTGAPSGGGASAAETYLPVVSVNLDKVFGGSPNSPNPNSLVAQAPGYRFTAAAAGSITALRSYIRLPANSSATSADVTFRLQINGVARDVTGGGTVFRSKYYTLIEAIPSTPITYPANADIYFCALVVSPTGLMLEIPTQNVTDNYNSRGMLGDKPTAQITEVNASAPLTFTTLTPTAASDTYPSLELGTKTPVVAKVALEALQVISAGPAKGWGMVDSQPPRIVARHNGQAYSLPLVPDTLTTGYVAPGTPISLAPTATLGENEMSVVPSGNDINLYVRYAGIVRQIGGTGMAAGAGPAGPAGPANTLAIGTVTTLAAGSSATASVTGTAPSQTLNLGIPTGATGAAGAGGAGQAYLSSAPAGNLVSAHTPVGTTTGTELAGLNFGWEFIPTADIIVTGLRDSSAQGSAGNIKAQVWRKSDQVKIAEGTSIALAARTGVAYDSTFAGVTLTAGVSYIINWSSDTGKICANTQNYGTPTAFPFFTTPRIMRYTNVAGAYPSTTFGVADRYPVTFDILYFSPATTKSVLNPLDPIDFPVLTAAAGAANGSVFLLDTGSAAPRLVRKRADGTLWYGPFFSTTP